MPRKYIDQFMWSFQHVFRSSVEAALQQSLKAIGVDNVEPTVVIVGTLIKGGLGHPLCIEPEDGPIVPSDFDGLDERARDAYRQDSESQVSFSDARSHTRKHEEFRDRAYGTVIAEVLEAKLGLRFFVSLPTQVEQHRVFTAVGIPQWVLDSTPRLAHEKFDDHFPVTRSLIHGAVDQILGYCTWALCLPEPGAGLGLGVSPSDVAKAAGNRLTHSIVSLAGTITGGELFDGLNRLATTPYERRVGVGSLLIAKNGSEYIDISVTLRRPVRITETRALRKLLETSSLGGDSLLTDGEVAYGLGRRIAEYPQASESVFQVVVTGNGVWELRHVDSRLAIVEFGAPRLPVQELDRARLDDICSRLFSQRDSGALWGLAQAAREAEHGTMLVISDRAELEAIRLGSQAFPVNPTRLTESSVKQVIEIDGAVLVDPFGCCHAIGVILDGAATAAGDRSRGARYNSAVRYLATARANGAPTVILLVSEDGMINLLPNLPPRVRRADRDALIADLREAAAIEPVHGERFYKAYRRVEAKAFYLSQDQIDEVNALVDSHWERRMAEGGSIRLTEKPLTVSPEMNDDYLID